MPPLCKGRWHGAAVTEGLPPLSSIVKPEGDNPSVASRQLPLHKGAKCFQPIHFHKTKVLLQNTLQQDLVLLRRLSASEAAKRPQPTGFLRAKPLGRIQGQRPWPRHSSSPHLRGYSATA